MEYAAAFSALDALSKRTDKGASAIWSLLAKPLRRARTGFPIDQASSSNQSRLNDAMAQSGLLALTNELAHRLNNGEDRSFSPEDVESAARIVDAFWYKYLGSAESAREFSQTPVDGVDFSRSESLHAFAAWLTESLLLPPRSVAEWRREEYLSRVSKLLELASGSLAINKRNESVLRRIGAVLQNAELRSSCQVASDLARGFSAAEALSQDDVVAIHILSLSSIQALSKAERA